MKINLQRLEKMAAKPDKEWTIHDYRMAHQHVTQNLGWEMTKWANMYWDVIPTDSERNHRILTYINPRTKGCYYITGAIRYLVESMNK